MIPYPSLRGLYVISNTFYYSYCNTPIIPSHFLNKRTKAQNNIIIYSRAPLLHSSPVQSRVQIESTVCPLCIVLIVGLSRMTATQIFVVPSRPLNFPSNRIYVAPVEFPCNFRCCSCSLPHPSVTLHRSNEVGHAQICVSLVLVLDFLSSEKEERKKQ